MNRGEWHDAARLIAQQHPDWPHTRIAEALGVTQSAVYKVLNPDRKREYNRRENSKPGRQAQKNAWQRAYDQSAPGRGQCGNPVCGQPMGIGAAHHRHRLCRSCYEAIGIVRQTLAEGMWAAGWRLGEMAEAFGVTPSYFAAQRPRGFQASIESFLMVSLVLAHGRQQEARGVPFATWLDHIEALLGEYTS